MAGPSNPKRADPDAEYGQALGGALSAGIADLLQHADELERVQTEEEDRRRELEAKLSLGSQDRPMVPVREWVRNPYFVGGLASDEPGGLFPKLKEDLEEVFDGRGGLGYFEVIIGGASGFGKTSGLMRAIDLRVLYEVSCFANPQRSISPDRGMVATDSILLANYSFTEANARSTLYTYLQRSVDSIDYFRECFPRDPKYTKEMRFPRNVVVRPGITVETGATAENLLTAVMDEANKYPLVEHSDRVRAQGEVYDVAEKLRGQCFNRQRNRFMLTGGEMPRTAKLVIGCSAQYPDDFVERRTEMARSGKLEHAVLVIRYPEWGTKPRSTYTLPWVTVMVSPDGGAEVLDGDDAAERRVELESRGWTAHEVPGEHVPSFREAPELSVRELLGIATKAIEPFMRKREAIVAAVEARRQASESMRLGAAGTQHPFTVVETTLRDAATFVREYLCAPDPTEGGELRPRVSPGATRYAHFDLSENKCGTGFCVGHVLDVREIARSRREEGGGVERTVERAPWIWADFYLRIVAPKDEQVDYAACRSLVFEMTAMGFRFGMISFDQWQSVDARQRLEEKGYDVGLVSMDRDDGAYQALRRATYEQRLLLYQYEPLFDELLSVEMVKGKVVPRRGKTKDVADALAAVVQHCETLGMTQQSWNDPDARMVLAPFFTSAYAPPPGAPAQGLGVPRAHLESHGMGTYLDDLGERPEGPPEINTRTYGREPKGPRDDLLSRALARSSGRMR